MYCDVSIRYLRGIVSAFSVLRISGTINAICVSGAKRNTNAVAMISDETVIILS